MKQKITTFALVVALLCIAVLFVYIRISIGGDGRESFGDKAEETILQSTEYTHRGKPISGIEFLDYKDYHLMCVPGIKGHRIWIMLNPKHPPYYKQIASDESDYTLSRAQVYEIVRARDTILN